MRINRSPTYAGGDTEGPDAGELVIVCCVSACGLAATGLHCSSARRTPRRSASWAPPPPLASLYGRLPACHEK